jgi:hypothetical protein
VQADRQSAVIVELNNPVQLFDFFAPSPPNGGILNLKPVRGQPQAASNRYKRPDPKAITQLAIQTF